MFILCSASLNGTAISTLNSCSWSAGMQRVLLGAAGNHQAEFVALMRQEQMASIATRKINALSSVVLGNGNLIFRTVAEGGTGTSTYISLTGTNGATLLVPRTINWSAGSPASLSLDMIFLSSTGSAAPLTVGSTTGSLTEEADVWVGSGDGVNSITIDFGFQINLPSDGYLYPKHSFVLSQRPVISRTLTEQGSLLTTANLNPGSVSTLTATFNKIDDGGVRNGTLAFALTGHYHVDSVEGAKPGTVREICAGVDGLTIA